MTQATTNYQVRGTKHPSGVDPISLTSRKVGYNGISSSQNAGKATASGPACCAELAVGVEQISRAVDLLDGA